MGKVKLTNGKNYILTLENGHILEGVLHELRCMGNEISFWIDRGSELISVSFSETKDIKLKQTI